MSEMTLPSGHRFLRPSVLPLGHGGYPQHLRQQHLRRYTKLLSHGALWSYNTVQSESRKLNDSELQMRLKPAD